MTLPALSLLLEYLALGAVAGFLAGLLGVGGGMMMVPFLTFTLTQRGVDADAAIKMAIATSMATILFTSISSVRAHHRRGAVRWDIVRAMAPGFVVGGLISGAGVFALVKGRVLALVFALFIGYTALRMLRARAATLGRPLPGRWVQGVVAAVIALVSGLVGAGGAFMSVPFMTRSQVPMHHAVATSAAFGFPIAAANTIGYVVAGWHMPPAVPGAMGYIDVVAVLTIAAASVVLAPLGARVAHGMDVQQLRRLFACLLIALAGYMFYRVVA
jgi:uncharacterized protein